MPHGILLKFPVYLKKSDIPKNQPGIPVYRRKILIPTRNGIKHSDTGIMGRGLSKLLGSGNAAGEMIIYINDYSILPVYIFSQLI